MTDQTQAVWRDRRFLTVWGGQSVSMFGTRVSYIAWIWWVLGKTDSAAAVAAIGIAAALPSLLLGPIAGAIVDRLDRRRVLYSMDATNAVLFGLAAALLFTGHLHVWHVYAFTALSATAMAFHRPSLQSSITNLVDRSKLTRANSLYQISRGVCGLIGLLLGGILVGLIGVAPTLALDAATFLLAALSLLLVRFPSPRISEGRTWRSLLHDTIGGFRFLADHKTLLYMLGVFGLVNFLIAPVGVLFSIMSKDVFNAGAQGLGMLNAAVSAGVLAGGFLTASAKRFKQHGLGIMIGVVGIGVLLALFGISKNLYVSLAFLAGLGVFVTIANVFESVVFQTRVPNELQGRVFAAQFAVCDGLQPVSLAVIGGVLTAVSAPTVLFVSGVAIAVAGLAGLALPGVRDV